LTTLVEVWCYFGELRKSFFRFSALWGVGIAPLHAGLQLFRERIQIGSHTDFVPPEDPVHQALFNDIVWLFVWCLEIGLEDVQDLSKALADVVESAGSSLVRRQGVGDLCVVPNHGNGGEGIALGFEITDQGDLVDEGLEHFFG